MVIGFPSSRVGELGELGPERGEVDLVRTVREAQRPGAGEHLGQRLVAGQAGRAEELDRAVEDLLHGPRDRDLDGLDLGHRGAVADGVHEPGGLEHQQPQRLDLRGGTRRPTRARRPGRPAAGRTPTATSRARAPGPAPAPPCRATACSGGSGRDRAGPARSRSPRPRRRGCCAAGTRTSSNDDLGVPAVVAVVVPEHASAAARSRTPGVSRGTRTMLCRRCRSARRVGRAHDDQQRAVGVHRPRRPPLAAA